MLYITVLGYARQGKQTTVDTNQICSSVRPGLPSPRALGRLFDCSHIHCPTHRRDCSQIESQGIWRDLLMQHKPSYSKVHIGSCPTLLRHSSVKSQHVRLLYCNATCCESAPTERNSEYLPSAPCAKHQGYLIAIGTTAASRKRLGDTPPCAMKIVFGAASAMFESHANHQHQRRLPLASLFDLRVYADLAFERQYI